MHGASTLCGACNCTFASKEGSGCDTAVCRSEASCGDPEACCAEETNSGNGSDSCGPDADAKPAAPTSCARAAAAQASAAAKTSDAIAAAPIARHEIRRKFQRVPAARPVPSSPKFNRRFSATIQRTKRANSPTATIRRQNVRRGDARRCRQKEIPRPLRRSTAIPVSNPLNSAKNEK